MPYPSCLWLAPLGVGGELNLTPEQTLSDLLGEESAIRARSLPFLRRTASPEEIGMRQRLFFRMLREDDFAARIAELDEEVRGVEQLAGEMDRAGNREERVLLFLPLMRRYFALGRRFADFSGEENRMGEVGAFWRESLGEFLAEDAEYRCRERLSRRREALTLAIHGSDIRASEGTDGMRQKLLDIFAAMDMGDAVPPIRQPQRAAPSVARAYAGVYDTWYESAAGFYEQFAPHFLEGDRDLRKTFLYAPELEFLLDFTAYFRALRDEGYPLAAIDVTPEREIRLKGMVDPSLHRRCVRGEDVVPNDLDMTARGGGERLNFYILSGANGGGKTTYLRAAALNVLFFSAGCPVTAQGGRMMPVDGVFTHFPANESFENSGRFANEAERAEAILEAATENSFAVFNETYSGADEKKSEEHSARLAKTLSERGTFGVYVTHIHSLTGGDIPTLAAVVDPGDENRRTYRIRRVGATSTSYARDILKKYGLDAASLGERARRQKGGC